MRLGLMGFGLVGRQIYPLALEDPRFDVVAIADVARREILNHLLTKSGPALSPGPDVTLDVDHLVSERGRARLMPTDHPTEIPWDAFGVDLVIDATGRFRSRDELEPHLTHGGARRVLLAKPPVGPLDRLILSGVNEREAHASDRIVSACSPTTTATGLALKSRAPVPDGSVVDLVVERERATTVEAIHDALEAAAASDAMRGVLQFTREPVVSSDIIGNPHSSVFDAAFTQLRQGRFLKALSWYDNEWGYANRVCDVLGRMATWA